MHCDYDWTETGALKALITEIKKIGGLIGASSEGGLFEYGSDDAIVSNLRILHAGARFVTGSVTNDDKIRRRMIAIGIQDHPARDRGLRAARRGGSV
jgi:hypothetical protein